MPRIIFSIVFIFISTSIFSQSPKTVPVKSQKPPVAKPVAPKILKDLRDSASYTAGIHIVNKYRSQNIYNFNGAVVAKACSDLQSNKPQLISNSDADNAVMAYQGQLMSDPKKTVKPPVAGIVLNDIRDSASYAAGIYLINFFREFDITNFNPAIITTAINKCTGIITGDFIFFCGLFSCSNRDDLILQTAWCNFYTGSFFIFRQKFFARVDRRFIFYFLQF